MTAYAICITVCVCVTNCAIYQVCGWYVCVCVHVQEVRVAMHKYKLILSTNKMEECVKTGEDLLAFYFRNVYQQVSMEGNE